MAGACGACKAKSLARRHVCRLCGTARPSPRPFRSPCDPPHRAAALRSTILSATTDEEPTSCANPPLSRPSSSDCRQHQWHCRRKPRAYRRALRSGPRASRQASCKGPFETATGFRSIAFARFCWACHSRRGRPCPCRLSIPGSSQPVVKEWLVERQVSAARMSLPRECRRAVPISRRYHGARPTRPPSRINRRNLRTSRGRNLPRSRTHSNRPPPNSRAGNKPHPCPF
jgi:hypothetical protein